MNRQKDKNQHSLRLAVATATLGMSMGVSPGVVLASPDMVSVQEPIQVAAAKVDPGRIDPKVVPAVDTRPGTVFPKLEQPGVQHYKLEQPGVQYPKVEQPGMQYPKVEQVVPQK
jgi:hypothetical protein